MQYRSDDWARPEGIQEECAAAASIIKECAEDAALDENPDQSANPVLLNSHSIRITPGPKHKQMCSSVYCKVTVT